MRGRLSTKRASRRRALLVRTPFQKETWNPMVKEEHPLCTLRALRAFQALRTHSVLGARVQRTSRRRLALALRVRARFMVALSGSEKEVSSL